MQSSSYLTLVASLLLCGVTQSASSALLQTDGFDQLFAFTDNTAGVVLIDDAATVLNIVLWDASGSADADKALTIAATSLFGSSVIAGEINYASGSTVWSGTYGIGSVGPGASLTPGGTFRVGVSDGSIDSWEIFGSGIKVNYTHASNSGSFTIGDIDSVPIPAAGALLISALAGVLVIGRRGAAGNAVPSH